MSSNGTGRARSCTGCRQVKLACDARRTAPHPCSRCKSKGLQCRFDSNFKRIPMRRVAQEITKELHKLVPTDSPAAHAATPSKSPPATGTGSNPSIAFTPAVDNAAKTLGAQPSFQSAASSQPWLQVVENDYYVSYCLGNVILNSETIITLMRHFESYYLPHAPFLMCIDSVYALSIRSPLLFWTMILVATREHIQHEGLYEQICVTHGVLLSQLTQNAIHDIEEIHALLLLCLWPVPRTREKSDPSWGYIGLATNAAMSIDCHKPLFAAADLGSWRGLTPAKQTASQTGAEILALTWVHCFQTGARIASFLGLPPPFATDVQFRSVTKAVATASSSISAEQNLITEILRLSCFSTSEVDYADEIQARFSLIHMFDAQLDTLHQSNHSYWTPELDMHLLSSKLFLYPLIMTTDSDQLATSYQNINNKQLILLRMRDTALKLISRMTQLSNTPANNGLYPAGALTFYPKHYFTSLHMAATTLFRFLASYQGLTQQDTTTALDGLVDAHKVLQSLTEHRDAVKSAIHLQFLAEVIRNRYSTSRYPLEQLAITSRLGASVQHDAVFRASQYRNRDPDTGASPHMSNWIDLSSDPRHRLPSTPDNRGAVHSSATTSHHSGADESQSQSQMMAAWSGWDNHMNDFELVDSWSNDILAQIDPVTQAQMEAATLASVMGGINPFIGQ